MCIIKDHMIDKINNVVSMKVDFLKHGKLSKKNADIFDK